MGVLVQSEGRLEDEIRKMEFISQCSASNPWGYVSKIINLSKIEQVGHGATF